MTDHITRRAALAMTSAALAASCVDNKALSSPAAPITDLPITGEWSAGVSLPFPVQEIYPCAHNGALHLAGGFIAEDGRISGPTDAYHLWALGTDAWSTSIKPIPTPRHHPHLISFQNRLLVFAGFESHSEDAAWVMQTNGWRISDKTSNWLEGNIDLTPPNSDEGWVFYPPIEELRDYWTSAPDLPAPCAEAVVGVLGDGALHLAGGRTPNGEANAVWTDHGDTDNHFVLTGLTDAWQRAAPCLTKRNSAAGDVIDGNLHIVGGRTVIERQNVATHEVYDHREDKWRAAAPMPQAQGGLAAAAVGGKLYAFGGEYFDNGGGVYKEAWAYDPATDAWIALPDMPNPRHGLGAVALDGKIYVIGGALQASGVETSALVEVFTP